MSKLNNLLKIILLTFFLAVGGSTVAWSLGGFFIPKSWKYKITIEVETPEGIKTGSAVRQVNARRELAGYINPSGGIITYRVYGEAVPISLGRNGILFYLLDWDSNSIIEAAFPSPVKKQWEKALYYESLPSGKKAVLSGWKSFGWLKDFKSETKIERIDSNDFSEILGKGFKLRKVVIEITDEDVTWAIDPLFNKIQSQLGQYSRESFQLRKN